MDDGLKTGSCHGLLRSVYRVKQAAGGALAKTAAVCLSLWVPSLSHAAIASLDLANYQYVATYSLSNSVSDEASAITWNWDTNTLFVVGDAAQAVAQYSLSGTLLNSMTLSGFPSNDPEGITYIGNGQFVIALETNFDATLLTYSVGGTATFGSLATVSVFGGSDATYGFEGVSYDPSNGHYFFIEEKGSRTLDNTNPGSLYDTTLNFGTLATTAGAPVSIAGVTDISDVQALSTVMQLGSPDFNNLLIVSHEGHRVMEVDRTTGSVLSQFLLSGISGETQSEGVTIDGNGIIYVVDEGPSGSQRMYVLAPVPLPPAVYLALAALGSLFLMTRRRGV